MNENQPQFGSPNERPQPIFFARKEFDGTNSEIREHHYPDGTKLVVTRLGARKGGFTFDEAHGIARDVREYHETLLALGVCAPEISGLFVEYEPSLDRSVVVKTSPWAGHEVKKLILESDSERDRDTIIDHVKEMVAITKPIGKKRHSGYELMVGIDPHASNYIRSEAGKMHYVDLFPARIRKDGKAIVEWPHPKTETGEILGRFKHFDIRGIMLIMSAQLARLKPRLKSAFEHAVFEEFRDVLTKEEYAAFKNELANTPWMRLRRELESGEHVRGVKLIHESLDARPFGIDYNIYTLREMALELAALGIMKQEELESFFKASHFEDMLPDEHVLDLKQYLIQLLKGHNARMP